MHEDATSGPKETYERARDVDGHNLYTDSYLGAFALPSGTNRRRQTDDCTGGHHRRVIARRRLDVAREGKTHRVQHEFVLPGCR